MSHGTSPELTRPAPPLRAQVRRAFVEVLGLDEVGDEDDFFALGGDSILSVALCLRLEELTGQTLRMTALYDASSVAALAERLERGPSGRARQRVIALRAGRLDAGAPLFIIHGLGGSVLTFRNVAVCMSGEYAIFGLEPLGLDGEAAPLERVEDMAKQYLDDIAQVVGEGPFVLAGYSFGGLVAFEIGRMLQGRGRRLEPLILLDSFPHARFWPVLPRVQVALRVCRSLAAPSTIARLLQATRGRLAGKSFRQRTRYLMGAAQRGLTMPFDLVRSGWVMRLGHGTADQTAADPLPGVFASGNVAAGRRAFAAYRPGFYEGAVHFVVADREHAMRFNPAGVWTRHVARLHLHRVQADHQGLVRGDAPVLAAALSRILGSAPGVC